MYFSGFLTTRYCNTILLETTSIESAHHASILDAKHDLCEQKRNNRQTIWNKTSYFENNMENMK